MDDMIDFYKDKKIFITGNTGFKGSWMTFILLSLGAKVTGYALKPQTSPNMFSIIDLESNLNLSQNYGDIRGLDNLKAAYAICNPDIVIHLAAQPIVRESYKDPLTTYTTNVNGTINILECLRTIPGCSSFINVTTDKVYKNYEWEYGYREDDPLDGFDPYSNSKSCSEIVTHSYKESFFADGSIAISTVRAGNVIGGGDFSTDRIIPDCVRAIVTGDKKGDDALIEVRNPYSTRPYQHVLEPIFAYLMIAKKQYEDRSFAGYYNVGPDDCDCVTTGNLVSMFCKSWNELKSDSMPTASWKDIAEKNAPHEANFLKLDCSRLKSRLGWRPRWHIDNAIEETVRWTKVLIDGGNTSEIRNEMEREIKEYRYWQL